MSEDALLPCPFCGGQAEWKSGGPGCAWISCASCPAETGDGSIDRIKAAWNRRALPAAEPAEDVRAANRVTYDDKGNLDEIVTDAGVHLEDLGGNRWFLGAARSDGTEVRVWIRGKVTMIEDDAQEAKT